MVKAMGLKHWESIQKQLEEVRRAVAPGVKGSKYNCLGRVSQLLSLGNKSLKRVKWDLVFQPARKSHKHIKLNKLRHFASKRAQGPQKDDRR